MTRILRIAEFCETGTGGTPSRNRPERYFEAGTVPWVKSGELRESIINKTEERVTETALEETNVKLVPAGTLLLAMYGATVGRLGILGIPAATNQAICHIIPDPAHADTRYLFYSLQAQIPILLSRRVGGAQPNINQGIVRNLEVFLPSLVEQRRIAKVLDRAAALRAKRRAALAQLDSLTQSIFLDLFGDPATNPKAWPTCKLHDIADKITDGEHQTPRRTTEGVKLLSARNIRDGSLDVTNVDYISQEEYERIKRRCNPELGDVLISCSGTIGHVATVSISEPFSLVRSVALIKPKRELVDSFFLEHHLRTPALQTRMQRSANASSQANLFQGQIRELPATLPPYALQCEFSTRVKAVEKLKVAQRASQAEMDALFASLQHRAFRGEL